MTYIFNPLSGNLEPAIPDNSVTAAKIASSAVTTEKLTDNAITSAKIASSITFTGVPLAPTATAGTNTTQIATTAFVSQAITTSALQPGAIGSTVQAYHARLDSLSGITNADGGIEKTGANTYGRYTLTAFGKSLVDDEDASTARSTLGLTIGSNVQAWDANLDAIAAIATSGPIERTGPGTWGVSDRVRLFGGNGEQGAGPSTTQTLSEGLYYYSSWTIPQGVTITISKFARIYVSGSVTINGTITVTQATPSAATFGASFNGISGSNLHGQGLGSISGFTYPYSAQPFGSAGTNGVITIQNDGSGVGRPGQSGNGGGGLWIEAKGAIEINSTAIINAVGTAGSGATITSGNCGVSGGGGGSGGTLIFSSLASITINNGAAISVAGGNGGSGFSNSTSHRVVNGGGGGGGGQVVLIAPSIQNSASSPAIDLNGGAAGSQANNSQSGSLTLPSIGGGSGGGGNGGGGGSGLTTIGGGTTNYSQLNAVSGANGVIVSLQIKAVA